MKTTMAMCLTAAGFFSMGITALASDPDDAAIIEAVDQAYVHGIHIEQDMDKVRNGFHESFVMFVKADEGLTQVTRDGWIERIEAAKAKGGQASRPETTAKISVIGHQGDAAVVQVDLFRDGKQAFTDYISLYRFENGWKLVGKIYQRH